MELKQFELSDDNLLDVIGGATIYVGTEKAKGMVYTVQQGDTVEKIARGFGTKKEIILRLNRMADVKYGNHIIGPDNKVQPGWIIRIK